MVPRSQCKNALLTLINLVIQFLKVDSVYLKHNNATYVDQPLSTEAMNINPFAVIINEGTIDLSTIIR